MTLSALPALATLLARLDPNASLADRHVWLIDLLQWVRGDSRSAPAAVARLQQFMVAVEAQPEVHSRLQAWWRTLLQTIDVTPLLADFGFAPRTAFISELTERIRGKLLPGTPETVDASELFSLLTPSRFDAQWLTLLDETQIGQLTELLTEHSDTDEWGWQHSLLDALTYCTAQIRATGFSPELRLRMSDEEKRARPFHALPADVEDLRRIFFDPQRKADELQEAVARYRERMEACRRAINSIYAHLDEHGISVGMVFRLRQLRARFLRVRELLDCLLSPKPAAAAVKQLARMALVAEDRKSIRALIAANSTLLAAKMAERSAEAGEHYITRNRADYRDMLGKALGGGAITAITTALKFAVIGLGLSAFWSGMGASLVYAGSFVVIQLLHFTLATKQPAMTAPVMAAKLKELGTSDAIGAFVDEVTHLVRSQSASVLGNVLMVVPGVVLINLLILLISGQPMISQTEAQHVLLSLSLLGPTLVWAAFTGGLLFVASLMAGWVENWFVLNRLESAMRYNPRITATLGGDRAGRWASFVRDNISGLASNVALGFMLGMIPPITDFLGLQLDVRHVTLSAGQLAAAGASLGLDVWRLPAFWWCVAAIPLIGLLNLGVSFYCAFRLAAQAHSVGSVDRKRIRSAIWLRLRQRPSSFFTAK
ncbi:MAG: site-specific recombinase [Polaromonas sp.]|nr:site-specific recombinase [Polaromonas sp.]